MGCDIHPIIEIVPWGHKPEEEWAYWKAIAVPPSDRNYELFAHLAGVRGPQAWIWIPRRGYPKDLSDEAKAFLSMDHSPTWFTLEEAQGFNTATLDKWAANVWERWLNMAEAVSRVWQVPARSIRFVMDFDS